MAILINRDAKGFLYDKVASDMVVPLVIRVCSGVISFLCVYYAIKNLPIFLVSLIMNTSPLFTGFLAYLFLKEKISKVEIFGLMLAFFGVYVLLSSSDSKTQKGHS